MKIRTEVKVALISIFTIAIFIWAFNFFKGKNLTKQSHVYYVVYEKINGLKESNPVTLNGFRIGLVNNIGLIPGTSGQLLVKILLEEDFSLPENTIADIYSADLMGTKSIRLNLGDSETMAMPGDTLAGSLEGSLTEQVSAQVLPIKNKAEKLLGSIDSILAVLQYTFNEEFSKNFNSSLENITSTLEHLNHASYAIDTLITKEDGSFASIVNNLEAFSSTLKNNMDELENILVNVSMITDSLAKSNIKSLVYNMDKSLEQVQQLLSGINEGKGTIGLLITNDSLYRNLEALSHDLDLLLVDMRENPKKYVHISLFGGGKSKKQEDKNNDNLK